VDRTHPEVILGRRDDGKDDSRGAARGVMDRLYGFRCLRHQVASEAGVRVPVELGEVAAGYLDPDAVVPAEDVAGGHEVYSELIDLARDEKSRRPHRLSEAGAYDSVAQVSCVAVGMDVDQLGGEIGVGSGRARPKHGAHGTGDLRITFEGRRRVDKYVLPPLVRPLVEDAGRECGLLRRGRTAPQRG